MSFFSRLSTFLIGKSDDDSRNNPFLTRQELNDSIIANFMRGLEDETTNEGLLFPTSFHIFLNPEDYEVRRQSFLNTVNEVVGRFNEIIRKQMKRYPDFICHSTKWTFQFAPFSDGSAIDLPNGMLTGLPRKKICVLTSIYADHADLYADSSDERIVATVHDLKNSMIAQPFEINRSAFRNVSIESKDRFTVDIRGFGTTDSLPAENRQQPAPTRISQPATPTAQRPKATLRADNSTFIGPSGPSTMFRITGTDIYVSGSHDNFTRDGIPVARLNSEDVLNPHLKIHDDGSGTFFIAALGEVRLNEIPLPADSNNWTRLPNNSSILINDEIQLTFKLQK